MPPTIYHQTTSLTREQLKDAVRKAAKEKDCILLIYLNARQPWTPSDIFKACERAGHNFLLTNVRRAITNLAYSKDLIKTTEQKEGMYGKPETFWKINPDKHPSPQPSMQRLF